MFQVSKHKLRQRQLSILFVITLLILVLIIFYDSPSTTKIHHHDGSSSGAALDIAKNSFQTCFEQVRSVIDINNNKSKLIYVITPTFHRPEMKAELIRLSQTLLHAKSIIHWIVVEDNPLCSSSITDYLQDRWKSHTGGYFTHLASPMPEIYRKPEMIRKYGLPRGVSGRRAALKWIIDNSDIPDSDIIYFADDDNSYDVKLFTDELILTKRISMFPVGLIRPYGVSSPLLDYRNKVVGFLKDSQFGSNRKYPIDMGGFAISVGMIRSRKPTMPYLATWEEEKFLKSMEIKYSEIEPLANNCTKILVWHTMTMTLKGNSNLRRINKNRYKGIKNIRSLIRSVEDFGNYKL